MTEEFRVDGQVIREQGGNDHAKVQPLRGKARLPEEWLNDFYTMFGYAAHEFLPSATRYMTKREQDLNTLADGRQEAGDNLYEAASQFEITDIHGGTQVRRSYRGSE